MNTVEQQYRPGTLVRVRDREWVVQPSGNEDWLVLRPLGGSDKDVQVILPELEKTPVSSATFPMPDKNSPGPYRSAVLLRDALRLKLRNGAGPFRSFGHIAVEPRAYQLVPLLMALNQETVRLLIADDVGIGKTIEAGLILRELIDRGEVQRFSVLCPPHLVDQWKHELSEHFHIEAVAVSGSTAARLERSVPAGESIFQNYKYTIVSLDYIKSDRHADNFRSCAPECIIVDEAHTCTTAGKGHQLRFRLLKSLVDAAENLDNRNRHLIMLTATPHSGDDNAFSNLLSLLDPKFALLSSDTQNSGLREELAQYFVQRRRKDIEEWQDASVFPQRMTNEITYKLSGKWGDFFDTVRAYCRDMALQAEKEHGEKSSIMWYATIALLRCVSSSPAAARSALTTRLNGKLEELKSDAADETAEQDSVEDRIDEQLDGTGEEYVPDDSDPVLSLEETDRLKALITEAESLSGTDGDPKLRTLADGMEKLLKIPDETVRPIVFCRYIATAQYVAAELKKKFPKNTVECVTGLLTPEEREEKIAMLEKEKQPILVATDCLSEGINLQEGFNAVVHYDLAWNPTRHEQREGRVDRFGQKSKMVYCTMLYGQDNPVDGYILGVIVRKAKTIKDSLGILVPLPDDDKRLRLALVKAAVFKERRTFGEQGLLDFGDAQEVDAVETDWQNAMEKAKATRTIFVQHRLKPSDVKPEWDRQSAVLGSPDDVETFVKESLVRLDVPAQKESAHCYAVDTAAICRTIPALSSQLKTDGIMGDFTACFSYPPEQRTVYVQRSHPFVTCIADYVLETALAGKNGAAARCGAYSMESVTEVTTVYLLRLRYRMVTAIKQHRTECVAEEAVTLAAAGRTNPKFLDTAATESLLNRIPDGNLAMSVISTAVAQSLDWFTQNRPLFETEAERRAQILQADHMRVRKASKLAGATSVTPCLPLDIIGVYVLLPPAGAL
jgi:superfamily II DNA or RNA helicase